MSGHDARTIEAVLAVIAEQRRVFASDEYATPQPLGGFKERFACDRIAESVAALPIAATPADDVGRVTAAMAEKACRDAVHNDRDVVSWQSFAAHLNTALAPAPDATDALRVALSKAADEFDLILFRLESGEPERAMGAARCGKRDAEAALATGEGAGS